MVCKSLPWIQNRSKIGNTICSPLHGLASGWPKVGQQENLWNPDPQGLWSPTRRICSTRLIWFKALCTPHQPPSKMAGLWRRVEINEEFVYNYTEDAWRERGYCCTVSVVLVEGHEHCSCTRCTMKEERRYFRPTTPFDYFPLHYTAEPGLLSALEAHLQSKAEEGGVRRFWVVCGPESVAYGHLRLLF